MEITFSNFNITQFNWLTYEKNQYHYIVKKNTFKIVVPELFSYLAWRAVKCFTGSIKGITTSTFTRVCFVYLMGSKKFEHWSESERYFFLLIVNCNTFRTPPFFYFLRSEVNFLKYARFFLSHYAIQVPRSHIGFFCSHVPFHSLRFYVCSTMGPSINDVTHVLRFLTPPSPLSPILLNRLFCILAWTLH